MKPLDCPRPPQRNHPQFKLTPAFRYALGLVCEACADPLDALSIRRTVLEVETVGGGLNPYGKLKQLEEMYRAPNEGTVKLLGCIQALAALMWSENTGKPEESRKALEAAAELAGYVRLDGPWFRYVYRDNTSPWFFDSMPKYLDQLVETGAAARVPKLGLGDVWLRQGALAVVGLGPWVQRDGIVDCDEGQDERAQQAADLLKLYIAEGFAAAWAKAETVGELQAIRWLLHCERHAVAIEPREWKDWLSAHRQAINERHFALLGDEASP